MQAQTTTIDEALISSVVTEVLQRLGHGKWQQCNLKPPISPAT